MQYKDHKTGWLIESIWEENNGRWRATGNLDYNGFHYTINKWDTTEEGALDKLKRDISLKPLPRFRFISNDLNIIVYRTD